jgi:hypothetical protein
MIFPGSHRPALAIIPNVMLGAADSLRGSTGFPPMPSSRSMVAKESECGTSFQSKLCSNLDIIDEKGTQSDDIRLLYSSIDLIR